MGDFNSKFLTGLNYYAHIRFSTLKVWCNQKKAIIRENVLIEISIEASRFYNVLEFCYDHKFIGNGYDHELWQYRTGT